MERGVKNREPSGGYGLRHRNKFGDQATDKARAGEIKLGTKQPLRLEKVENDRISVHGFGRSGLLQQMTSR